MDTKLTYRGRVLWEDGNVNDCAFEADAEIHLSFVLRGGGAMTLNIQPRVQRETWSLYWKESMRTDTECLKSFHIETDGATTIADLQVRP